jgi:cellulose biosynthesis protein BcsQ
MKYAFWNNKGGTGKTSLVFQTILEYAHKHPDKEVVVLDVCPQANLSELLLGGLVGDGSGALLKIQGGTPRATIGGYFQLRLPQPYASPIFTAEDFLVRPHDYNPHVPENVVLLPGDPMLELQATAVSTLANTQLPGSNAWLAIIDWLRDFVEKIDSDEKIFFIDCNPSFSIYTQIALSIADRLVAPVMADDSSRRALQNAFSLVYGLHLPSPIYALHSFESKLTAEGRDLPKFHLAVRNRLTQYMGPASAYDAVLNSINKQIENLIISKPSIFTGTSAADITVDVRDFGTTGVVAFAKGQPFRTLAPGRHNISGRRVQVKDEYRQNAIEAINDLVDRL